MVGSDDSLETSTVNSAHILSTIQTVHISSFPLKETKSASGGHAQIKPPQYALDLSTISIN
jgi:hypothetical protein